MTGPAPSIPNIPLRLAGRPTLSGLVVPWATGRTPDGRYRFGAVDLDRHKRAMTDRLCQTCGTPLEERIVFAMRDSDLRALTSHEPGMHAVCSAYAATACPMIAGRMDHYRTASLAGQLADLGIAFQATPPARGQAPRRRAGSSSGPVATASTPTRARSCSPRWCCPNRSCACAASPPPRHPAASSSPAPSDSSESETPQ